MTRTFEELVRDALAIRTDIWMRCGSQKAAESAQSEAEMSLSAAEWQVVSNHQISRNGCIGQLAGIKLVLKLTEEEERVLQIDIVSSRIVEAMQRRSAA